MPAVDYKGMFGKLNHEDAYSLAVRLTTIPDCPRSGEAIEAIADDLVELCGGGELAGEEWTPYQQAKWLVAQARRWKTWQGTAGLIELYRERFRTGAPDRTTTGPAYQEFPALPAAPEVTCSLCNDFGTTKDGFCQCVQGQRMATEMKPFLLRYDKVTPTKPTGPRPSEEDIRQTFEATQKRVAETIENARAVLQDPESTRERKEIARETLRTYGAADRPGEDE